MPPTTLRTPNITDRPAVRRLAELATYGHGAQSMIEGVGDTARSGYQDADKLNYERRSTGEKGVFNCLASMRIADYPGQPVGLSYTAPPLYSITTASGFTQQEDFNALAGALTELNLLAVMPRFRGRGVGAQLLTDVETRYAAAGYRTLFIQTATYADPRLIPWYTAHGYTFAEPGQPWELRYYTGDTLTGRLDRHDKDEVIGFKALAPGVTVTGGAVPEVTGILDKP